MKQLSMDALHRMSVEEYKETAKLPIVLVLDNIRSMHNIGALFRTADAFCIAEIYLCGITPCPPHREIHKTALGATESVAWKYYDNTAEALAELKSQGYYLLALEQTDESIPLSEANISSPVALLVGNEVDGVSDLILQQCDAAVEIPQFGTKHSLNVSVAGGIALWHLSADLFHLISAGK